MLALITFFKKLFSKKRPPPPPPSDLIEMVWSAQGVNPDGGSFFMPAGPGGKPFYDGTLPGIQTIPADCVGVKMVATLNPPPKGGASVLLYRYLQEGKIWIPGWCPSVDFAPGCSRMELDLSAYEFSTSMSLNAWGGYPIGLEANQGPIDFKVVVTLKKK